MKQLIILKKRWIKLPQHIGASAVPIVNVGDSVMKGQLIGQIPEGALGACVHASISGKVKSNDGNVIIICAD